MKFLLRNFIILSSFGILLYSATGLACPKNASDPFAITATMTEGPYKGHCIDTNRYRSAIRLTADQRTHFFSFLELSALALEGINLNDPKNVVIANFADAPPGGKEHFYVAVIPLDRIQGAVMQLTRLSQKLPIDHGQIRLLVSSEGKNIYLFDQTRDTKRKVKVLKDDIIVTVSGVRPMDHDLPYNAFKGLRPGYYGEEFQIGSQQNLTLNWIRSEKPPLTTRQYVLNIDKEKAQKALQVGLTVATESGVTAPYSTLTASCLNYAFRILHDVLGTSDKGLWGEVKQNVEPLDILHDTQLIDPDEKSRIEDLH